MRILVIEDDPAERDLLVSRLKDFYRAAKVSEIESVGDLLLAVANRIFSIDTIDLVVLEHHLPLGPAGPPLAGVFPHEIGDPLRWNDQKGGEIAVRFLRKSLYPGPILFYTHSFSVQIAEDVRRLPGVYHTTKLQGPEALRGTLEQIFAKHPAR